MIMLKDATPFKTYLWDGVNDDIAELLAKLPDGETVDISYCRFGKSTYNVIVAEMLRLNIINSAEPLLNEILQHNRAVDAAEVIKRERQHIKYEFYDEDGRRFNDFLLHVKESDKEVVWQLPPNISLTKYLRNASLVMLALLINFPKRYVDIYSHDNIRYLIDVLREFVTVDDYLECDSVWFGVGGGILMRVPLAADKSIYVPGDGVYTFDKWQAQYCMPGWFGVEKRSSSPRRQEIYKNIIGNVKYADRIMDLKKNRTMRSIITQYGGL